MAKRKILHISPWYPSKEEFLLGIFVQKQLLASQNYYAHTIISVCQTKTITSSVKRIKSKTQSIDEVIFYYRKGHLNKIRVLLCVFMEIMKHRGTKLIHAHIMGWSASISYIASVILNKRLVISEHWSGYSSNEYNQLTKITKFIRRFVAKKANALIVVSNYLKQSMISCDIKANYHIVENVVEGIVPKVAKNEYFSFIYVGDLDQDIKNVKGIIEAFSEFYKKNKDCVLHIIGDGKDIVAYKQIVRDYHLEEVIQFHGYKNNSEVFHYLSQSHCLILNSYVETFSVVCAEALLCGIPVIATKCGGPEAFLNDSTGPLIEMDNTKELSRAMSQMKMNYSAYDKDHLKQIVEVFSSKVIGGKFKALYDSVLGS